MDPLPDDPAFVPNLTCFRRLSRYVELAQQDRLEELFEALYQDDDPYRLFAPERMLLAHGLWEHRHRDIFDLAERTLALFDMRADRVRGPAYVWTAEAYQLTFWMDVARAWEDLSMWAHERPRGARAPVPRRFNDLAEFMRFRIPHLAMMPPWPVSTGSGLEFVPHIVGAVPWGDLQAQAAAEGKEFTLYHANPVVANCCRWQLVKHEAEGVFPDLPRSIDRLALAEQARVALADALTAAGPARQPEDIPF